jgi:hypothetical protein
MASSSQKRQRNTKEDSSSEEKEEAEEELSEESEELHGCNYCDGCGREVDACDKYTQICMHCEHPDNDDDTEMHYECALWIEKDPVCNACYVKYMIGYLNLEERPFICCACSKKITKNASLLLVVCGTCKKLAHRGCSRRYHKEMICCKCYDAVIDKDPDW